MTASGALWHNLVGMSAVLECATVSVVRSGRPILDRVDWRVESGQRWVVIGANGSGKTTLLNIASAHLHPSSGSVTILGERIGAVDVFQLRPRIGFASSAIAGRFPPGERVIDLVMTAAWSVMGRWHERYDDVDLARAQQVLDEWGLSELADRRYAGLSDGEKKRVQVARATMTDPELLLLDEPSANLDLGAREEMLSLLSGYATSEFAPAMVMVTHHVEEIPEGFTHVLMLANGRVSVAGPIAEALTSATLSEAFEMPLRLAVEDGRFAARAIR